MILQLFLFINFLLSNDSRIDDNFDEIYNILHEPKVVYNYTKNLDLEINFSNSGTSTALFIVNKKRRIKDIKIENSLGIAFVRQTLDGLNKINNETLQEKKYKTDNIYELSV
tara:strand:- start:4338 stop:4673 length:336 start_codon:yes stop_codon:yes gene_type:complete